MRFLPSTLLILGSLVSTGVVVEAQGLAEAAAREKEKRKAQKPVKVFTEEDLRRAGNSGRASVIGAEAPNPADSQATEGTAATEGTGEGTNPGDTAPAEAVNKPKEKSSFEVRAEQQKVWRTKLDRAQSDLSSATADIQKAEGILNNLPNYGEGRTEMMTQLELARARAAQAKQSIETLEAEGRQKGFR